MISPMPKGVSMKCPRCEGLMIMQSFMQNLSDCEAWRCINCGNVIAKREKILEFDSFSMFYHQQKTKKQ